MFQRSLAAANSQASSLPSDCALRSPRLGRAKWSPLTLDRGGVRRADSERTYNAARQFSTSACEVAGAGTFEWRIQGGAVEASPGLERLCGLEPGFAEPTVRFWSARVADQDRPRLLATFEEYIAARQQDCAFDFRIVTPDGEEKWIQMRTRLEYGPSGRAVHAKGVVMETPRDIRPSATTLDLEVARLARDLLTAKEAVEAANRSRQAHAAELGHDLRSPLSSIVAIADLLRERGASAEQCKELDLITRLAEQMVELVDDLVCSGRIAPESQSPELPLCDVKSFVGDMTEMFRVRAEEKNLKFSLAQDPVMPDYVRVDALKVRRVLMNVLDNAVKYTERGSITLSLNARPTDDERRLTLVFDIRDTGIGIAADDQTRVFDRFYTVPGANGQNGSGLGLSIACDLVRLIGGSISLDSTPGTGSWFRIEVPVERA